MKKIPFLLLVLVLVISCKESDAEKKAMRPKSSGNINNLQIVIDDALWQGKVGETIRSHFAAPVDGLPQEEPLYSINQITPESFSGFTQKHRIFMYIQKNDSIHFRTATDHYARPQKGYFISGPGEEEIIQVLDKKIPEMLDSYKEYELQEKQRRMALSLLQIKPVADSLGVTFKIPTAYRIAKVTDNFAWLRKDIRTGTTNIMVYELPWDHFNNDSTRVADIIKMRDSIGQAHIPGPTEGSYMITEEAYAPYLFESEVNGKFAYETKGTWEVKNDYMAGPFVNYIIKDRANKRLLVMEGFTFAPSVNKREYQFELEAIIKSAKIKE